MVGVKKSQTWARSLGTDGSTNAHSRARVPALLGSAQHGAIAALRAPQQRGRRWRSLSPLLRSPPLHCRRTHTHPSASHGQPRLLLPIPGSHLADHLALSLHPDFLQAISELPALARSPLSSVPLTPGVGEVLLCLLCLHQPIAWRPPAHALRRCPLGPNCQSGIHRYSVKKMLRTHSFMTCPPRLPSPQHV